jgi:hypothetical protein
VFELPAAFTERPETRAELQYLSQNAALLVADIRATVAGIAYLNYVLFPSAYTDSCTSATSSASPPSSPGASG